MQSLHCYVKQLGKHSSSKDYERLDSLDTIEERREKYNGMLERREEEMEELSSAAKLKQVKNKTMKERRNEAGLRYK